MNGEIEYLNSLSRILETGFLKPNRTGVAAYTAMPMVLQHDMSLGFPLLTTKKMGMKTVAAELEFFIKGLTDKKWLQDRRCTIWDEWCNPKKIPADLQGDERKEFQKTELDLGKVYGYQWRNFNSQDYDQLKTIVDKLKSDPSDRRMLCSAWNPLQLDEMALPPCHLVWGVQVLNNKLNLWWLQRSCDQFLGIPFNLASYALLLKLLALESGLDEGVLTGFLVDVHIYENHVEQVKEQLSKTPYSLPKLEIKNFTNIFDWQYTDIELKDYQSHPSISAPIAV
jgi:thymidylate synthase